MEKMDKQQAYCNIPVAPKDRGLLGMLWQDKVYVDTCIRALLYPLDFLGGSRRIRMDDGSAGNIVGGALSRRFLYCGPQQGTNLCKQHEGHGDSV